MLNKAVFSKIFGGILLASFVCACTAAAAGLSYPVNTVVSLSAPAVNFTILAGSTADSVQVNAGNIVVTISANETFTVQSASRDISPAVNSSSGSITNSLACNAGVAQYQLSSGTTGTGVFTIAPAAIACTAGGSTGTGTVSVPPSTGSGGGSVPTPIQLPPQTPMPTPGPIAYPLGSGSGIAHPNGTLVLDGSTVYLIKGGQRWGFRRLAEYNTWGFTLSQLVAANNADRALPFGGILKAFDGSVILDSSDNRTIYIVVGGQKEGFVSWAVFAGLGYKLSQSVKVDLSDYPAGPLISSFTAPHPNGTLINLNGTVYWVMNGQLQGFPSAAVFNSYGFSFAKVVNANSADMSLPGGAALMFRDGTLVNDHGTIFEISDGSKVPFTSLSNFTQAGYKLGNVLSGSLSGYSQSTISF